MRVCVARVGGGARAAFAAFVSAASKKLEPPASGSPAPPARNVLAPLDASSASSTRSLTASTTSSWRRKRTSRFVGWTLTSTVRGGRVSATNAKGRSALGSVAAYVASIARFRGAHSTSRSLMKSTNVARLERYDAPETNASTEHRAGASSRSRASRSRASALAPSRHRLVRAIRTGAPASTVAPHRADRSTRSATTGQCSAGLASPSCANATRRRPLAAYRWITSSTLENSSDALFRARRRVGTLKKRFSTVMVVPHPRTGARAGRSPARRRGSSP